MKMFRNNKTKKESVIDIIMFLLMALAISTLIIIF